MLRWCAGFSSPTESCWPLMLIRPPHSSRSTAAVVGIPFAFVLSLTAGYALYQLVERHVSSWSQALRWQAGLIGAGLLTTMLAGLR